MKRILLVIGLFAGLTCLSAQAQDLKANIPFDFQVGKTLMPAGEYRVSYRANGLLVVRQEGGQHISHMSLPLPAFRSDKAKAGSLQFNRYGDTYFLTTVWSPNSQDGYALPKSAREQEIASRAGQKQLADIALLGK